MSTNPLIALFLARRRGRGFDVVPHVHVWFGDRAGLACWRSLSETCYTFGPLAFIAKDLRSRLALAREMEARIRAAPAHALRLGPCGGAAGGSVAWMGYAEQAPRRAFAYVLGMCFGIVPARMELVGLDFGSRPRELWTRLGSLRRAHAAAAASNARLESARVMPAVVEALGLRNATLLLGVVYFERFERALDGRGRTLACLDWSVRYPLVFVCLLLAAKFTNDEARGLPRKFAAILADVEGLEEDVVLAALAQLELIVLETVAYDLSVPDDLATEERRHPAFVVSWLLAMLVHNGAGPPGLAPYPRHLRWLESAARLPVFSVLDDVARAEISSGHTEAKDLRRHRGELLDALLRNSIAFWLKSLFFFSTLSYFWATIHDILVPEGSRYWAAPSAWRPVSQLEPAALAVCIVGSLHNAGVISAVMGECARVWAHAANTVAILRSYARPLSAPAPPEDAALRGRLRTSTRPFLKLHLTAAPDLAKARRRRRPSPSCSPTLATRLP